MSEKRGNTGKLIYDFDVSANLEVQIEETWYRVTARDFRSFNGVRRINEIKYEGLLYMHSTNLIIDNPEKQGLIFDINNFNKVKKQGLFN